MESVECNPRQFMAGFRASPIYAAAYTRFFAGKKPAGDVTEAERREAFEGSEAAKLALIDYADSTVRLAFDPAAYAATTSASLEDYCGYVAYTFERMRAGADRAELEMMDMERSSRHSRAAQALLAEGIVPNELLGRAFARLVLVDRGLDTYASARRSGTDPV